MQVKRKERRYLQPGPNEVVLYSYLGTCSECNAMINDTLFACSLCPGNEWCETCAAKSDHNIDHPFLRVALNSSVEIETEAAQTLWKNALKASPMEHQDAVPFLIFVDQLSKYLQQDLSQGDVTALEAIFGDISTQEEISINSLEIRAGEFGLFVKRFGPIHLCLKKIQQVLTDGRLWFHGNMDLRKSAAILTGRPTKSFIIRYSSRTPGAFSINYVKDGEMKIFNRISNNMDGEGLFVHSDKQNKLEYSSFAAFIKSNSHVFSFPVDDPLPSFLRIKKQQLADMGSSSSIPFTSNFASPSKRDRVPHAVTGDDFYDALVRKADGFSNQMMSTSPTSSSSLGLRGSNPARRTKSAESSPGKRGIAKSSGANRMRNTAGSAMRDSESAESKSLRALLLDKEKREKPKEPARKAPDHYTNFFSDDEDDLPDIVAGM